MLKTSNTDLNRLSVEQYKSTPKLPLVIVLDNVRSAHNVGSAFRTCDSFAAEHLYLCGITPTPPNRDIYKTALSAEQSVAWSYYKNASELLIKLKEKNYTIIAVEQAKEHLLLNNFEVTKFNNMAFVFGNEVEGVSQEIMDCVDLCIEIPQFGSKHSLNVSVSLGVVLWEAAKQFMNK